MRKVNLSTTTQNISPVAQLRCIKLKTSLVLLLLGVAHAQTVPDAGALLRQTEQNLPMNRQASPLMSLPPPPLVLHLDQDGDKKAVFLAFKFNGRKRLAEDVLQAAVSPFKQQDIPYKDLRRIPDAVENAYRQNGWIVKVYLPRQDLAAGVLTIQILEDAAGSGSAIKP